MEDKEFTNKFPDYNGNPLLDTNRKLLEELRQPVLRTIRKLLDIVSRGVDDDSNYSVYTGTADLAYDQAPGHGTCNTAELSGSLVDVGPVDETEPVDLFEFIPDDEDSDSEGIALLHMQLHTAMPQGSDDLLAAMRLIERPLRHLKGKRLSFLCGDSGLLAIGAVLHHRLGNTAAADGCIDRLSALHEPVCGDSSLPDELLYGRAGYLYSLLFVQKHISEARIDKAIVSKVFKAIIDSGVNMSRQQGWKHPLMFAWHDKHYLGAAHGLAGIFYTLLQVTDPSLDHYRDKMIRPSIDYMLSLRFSSGNCPSSVGSSTGDKLVHWCHGAPGWIHMFIAAYKIFGDEKYLGAARDCADVVWQRGLLKKGYGLCHGTAGNGYAFLALYQVTHDLTHLHRAYKFAEWCFDFGKHGCRTPDTPFSLFEDRCLRAVLGKSRGSMSIVQNGHIH